MLIPFTSEFFAREFTADQTLIHANRNKQRLLPCEFCEPIHSNNVGRLAKLYYEANRIGFFFGRAFCWVLTCYIQEAAAASRDWFFP